MHFTVFNVCMKVTIILNCDVKSLSGTGPWKPNQITIANDTEVLPIDAAKQHSVWNYIDSFDPCQQFAYHEGLYQNPPENLY